MTEPLLEIGLYFDERTDKASNEKMDLQAVADHLVVYPLHLFKGHHNITLSHQSGGTRGLLVLYNHLVSVPQQQYLQELQEQGYIKSWAVFPPGTWPQDYFQQKEAQP